MLLDFHHPLACGTHLLTAIALLPPLVLLFRLSRSHTRRRRVSLVVYGLSAVSLYSASGLFHGIEHGPNREVWSSYWVWQRLDQTAIFWLIFGSNVPLAVYVLRKRNAIRILALLGSIATAGTAVLWFLPKPPHLAMVIAYLVMGTVGLIPIGEYYRHLRWRGVVRIALLASLYVAGGVFEAVEWPNPVPPWFTFHEVLHVCDMAGTAVHFDLLVWVVLRNQPAKILVDSPAGVADTRVSPPRHSSLSEATD